MVYAMLCDSCCALWFTLFYGVRVVLPHVRIIRLIVVCVPCYDCDENRACVLVCFMPCSVVLRGACCALLIML